VRVFHDWGATPLERRNLLWWLFEDTGWDRTSPEWEQTAKHTLARFRAQQARRPADPSFAALIEALSEASPHFRAWWPRHEVVGKQAGTKTIEHATLGTLRLHHLQSTPTSDPELRLTIYVPADEATREALRA
jgi:MmyB-like transcription regulator ligand binding domain